MLYFIVVNFFLLSKLKPNKRHVLLNFFPVFLQVHQSNEVHVSDLPDALLPGLAL